MTESESLLARWSRLKRQAEPEKPRDADAVPPDEGAQLAPDAEAEAEAFDPESLPPIESIDATTDLRAFLARGVPADLQREALRRAWTADPTIRDFIGLSENSWDFNAPGDVPGFGALDPQEVQRVLAHLLRGEEQAGTKDATEQPASNERQFAAAEESVRLGGEPPAETVSAVAEGDDAVDHAATPAEPAETVASDASQPPQRDAGEGGRRRHGGAMPRIDSD
ncbi:DUF3306 domain-containing protein [Pseudaminobacter sp. NGMCC 1.201702]|uniref:DUF3306 domain-containing protein n=1 Tax=Pseudaminobacter sp. NGMCC 1.201702 TaxID=3391825 RepID=UPI0039EF776B